MMKRVIAIWYRMLFFLNDTATTEIYTLSLHDALPISHFNSQGAREDIEEERRLLYVGMTRARERLFLTNCRRRSEEHTSELQSRQYLVCRLLLEKKKERDL